MNASTFARYVERIERRMHGKPARQLKAIRSMARRERAAMVFANGKLVGFRLRDGSMVCRKHRYRDEAAALVDLARIAYTSTSSKVPVRAYRCGECHGWHLTSKP
jgi:hypothetical protein